MKVLLVGEFSRVHTNLAEGLRELGCAVQIASTGDGYKQYPFDIYFADRVGKDNTFYKAMWRWRTQRFLKKNSKIFFGNDVVQLINPVFHVSDLLLMNIYTFQQLRKHNGKITLGAFGDDYYWIQACINGLFRYDMITENIKNHSPDDHLTDTLQNLYSKPSFQTNQYIAKNADSIIAGAYEYWWPYRNSDFADKTTYIPFPINLNRIEYYPNVICNGKIKILLGKQKGRINWKGMNVIEIQAMEFAAKYPADVELIIAESLPYNEYIKLYQQANVVIDQLYSYSPAMNALNALAAGKIVLGGGESEIYELIGERSNQPIYNILPDKNNIVSVLEHLLATRMNFEQMGIAGREFVEKHYSHIKVAEQYLKCWKS